MVTQEASISKTAEKNPGEAGTPPKFNYLEIAGNRHESPSLIDIDSNNAGFLTKKDDPAKFREWWQKLADKPYKEVQQITSKAAKQAGKPFDSLIKEDMSPQRAERLMKMISEKGKTEIPAANQLDASKLLKNGRGIETGKLNSVKMEDGRSYDIYIPKTVHAYKENGKLSVPTVVAVHGVENDLGDFRHQKDATGLNLIADQLGMVVIYPHAKSRTFEGTKHDDTVTSKLGKVGEKIDKKLNNKPIMAWNTGDADLLPSDKTYNDYKYMDKVLADVRSYMSLSKQVGILGHSDGGRFSQMYAAKRPNEIAAVATFTSTWMKDAPLPEEGKPFRAILSDKDNVLPVRGGRATKGFFYDAVLPTNIENSRPKMQEQVWSQASKCESKVDTINKDAGVETRQYTGKRCDVRIDMVKDNGHAVPDWRNLQEPGYDYYVFKTRVNRDHNFSYDVASWMKKHIINKH